MENAAQASRGPRESESSTEGPTDGKSGTSFDKRVEKKSSIGSKKGTVQATTEG
jgi:hypothetical protein